jgi:hypothetical protein
MRYRVVTGVPGPRRLLPALLLLSSLLLASIPAGATGDPANVPPAKAHGVTVAVIGDSLGDGVWSGFSLMWRNKPECRVVRRTRVGAGMTRADFPQWTHDLFQELANEQIDVAVLMFGLNDQTGIRDENRRGYLFRTEGWKQLYLSRVEALVRDLVSRKVTVVWLGLPVMRSDELNQGARWINGLLQDKLKSLGVVFVPLAQDFADATGAFLPYLQDEESKRNRQIRLEDGVHFTHYGYELIAAKTRAAIRVALEARNPLLKDAFGC